MEHPLLNDISHLSMEELQKKISELYNKLAYVSRNSDGLVANQLRMVIESYQTAYANKLAESLPKKDDGEDDFGTLIDIS